MGKLVNLKRPDIASTVSSVIPKLHVSAAFDIGCYEERCMMKIRAT